jgi:hypothetical protein
MRTLIAEETQKSHNDNHFIARMITMATAALVLAFATGCLILNVEVQKLEYHESGNVDYEVCLKPNQYFADACQPAGKQYVASLIKNIAARFRYDFEVGESLNYQYDYEITAQLVAQDGNEKGKVLYDNTEVLVPKQAIEAAEGEGFRLEQAVEIDYGKYNSLITAFRADYGLTLKANLIVTMAVTTAGTHVDFPDPLHTSQKIALDIPLSERTINVALDSDRLNNTGSLEKQTHGLLRSLPYLVLLGVSGVTFAVVLGWSIIIFARREAGRSEFEKELGQILHEYNQLIVEVEHVPEIPRQRLIQVHGFDELLDARETIQKPILHLPITDDRSLFMIDDDGTGYVYLLGNQKAGRKERENGKTKRARAAATPGRGK